MSENSVPKANLQVHGLYADGLVAHFPTDCQKMLTRNDCIANSFRVYVAEAIVGFPLEDIYKCT